MPGIDFDKMRKDKEKAKQPKFGGLELLNIEEGEYLLYIAPPVHEEDGVPYVEFGVHFKMGPSGRMIVNCDGLTGHPPFITALEKRKLPGTDEEDPEFFTWSDAAAGWRLAEQFANRHRSNKRIQLKDRWMFAVVPMAYRRSNRDDWSWEAAPDLWAMTCGKQIYNGITDVLFDVGDVTDPDKAVLVKLSRKGKGLDTEYSVGADVDTLREPMLIDDDLWAKLEPKLLPGEDGDLYKLVAQFCRTEEAVQSVLDGTDNQEDDSGSGSSSKGGRAAAKPRAATASSRRRSRSAAKAEPEEEVEEKPRRRSAAKAEPEEKAEPEPSRRRRRKAAEPEADEGSATASTGDDDVAELEAALGKRSRRRRSA